MNGDFKNIIITNCVFVDCRGIAIESVDGSHIEDIAISDITIRHVSKNPIFILLGSRLRGSNNSAVGTIKRIMLLPIKPICSASNMRRDSTSLIFIQYCENAENKILLNIEIEIPPNY